MKDYFWEFLCDIYDTGDLSDQQIEEALSNPYKAYELFEECFDCDRYGTGQMVQDELNRFKNHLSIRLEKKGKKYDSEVGPSRI